MKDGPSAWDHGTLMGAPGSWHWTGTAPASVVILGECTSQWEILPACFTLCHSLNEITNNYLTK